MIVTAEGGKPVEFFLKAGAINDNLAFKGFELDLPEGSSIYADKWVCPIFTDSSPLSHGASSHSSFLVL
jgi:hypothetical protein